MLSGIGDPAELATHGIGLAVPLRGVAKNLQDHISASVAYARRAPGPIHARMRADRAARDLAFAYFFGKGIASDMFGGVMAFLKTGLGGGGPAAAPDVQLLFNAAPMTAGPYLAPFVPPYADGFACRVALLRPESRGELKLRSANPGAAPIIRQNFLATDTDWKILRAGLRMVRDIGRQAPLNPFAGAELAPGDGGWSDDALDAHVRKTAITVHHPLGTCKMGPQSDPMAVVDAELKVMGVERLARRRCLGHARSRRRQHQCRRDHDRGESRRHDSGPPCRGAGQCLGQFCDDPRARRHPGARFLDHHRRAPLRAAPGRSRRRGHQDRAARRRHHARASADAERRQRRLRRAQCRQGERRARSQERSGGIGRAPPRPKGRRAGRELPARRDAAPRPRLRRARARQPAPHLLRDLGLWPDRPVGAAAGLCAGDPCRLGL